MIQCRKCGIPDEVSKCHEHHLVPKFMGGTDFDGRKYLCKKHHDIIHLLIADWIFEFVPEDKKEQCNQEIKKRTLGWIGIQ